MITGIWNCRSGSAYALCHDGASSNKLDGPVIFYSKLGLKPLA